MVGRSQSWFVHEGVVGFLRDNFRLAAEDRERISRRYKAIDYYPLGKFLQSTQVFS